MSRADTCDKISQRNVLPRNVENSKIPCCFNGSIAAAQRREPVAAAL